jgi:hypothetical protein
MVDNSWRPRRQTTQRYFSTRWLGDAESYNYHGMSDSGPFRRSPRCNVCLQLRDEPTQRGHRDSVVCLTH